MLFILFRHPAWFCGYSQQLQLVSHQDDPMERDHHRTLLQVCVRVQLHGARERLHTLSRVLWGKEFIFWFFYSYLLSFVSFSFICQFSTFLQLLFVRTVVGERELATARSFLKSTVLPNVTADDALVLNLVNAVICSVLEAVLVLNNQIVWWVSFETWILLSDLVFFFMAGSVVGSMLFSSKSDYLMYNIYC